jgi:hypothetical protein
MIDAAMQERSTRIIGNILDLSEVLSRQLDSWLFLLRMFD